MLFGTPSTVQCVLADWRKARAVRLNLEKALGKLQATLDASYPPVKVLVQKRLRGLGGEDAIGLLQEFADGRIIVRLALEVDGELVDPDSMASVLAGYVFECALARAAAPDGWTVPDDLEPPSALRRTPPRRADPLTDAASHNGDASEWT